MSAFPTDEQVEAAHSAYEEIVYTAHARHKKREAMRSALLTLSPSPELLRLMEAGKNFGEHCGMATAALIRELYDASIAYAAALAELEKKKP